MPDSGTSQTEQSSSRQPWFFEELQIDIDQFDPMHYRDLVEVSDSLMAGYARFIRQGLPGEMVGAAMLGATVNLYDIFEMRDSLPHLLRSLADRIEQAALS
ncbi:hypothetical protein P7228_08020 [Altererythrobacter arenosus]|uniref:Uncharacterized protein n=1 Tax=Altererythrobacter arenosus TaxID=3032592 RepID=A0ABY8FLQ4_9SPHN|nr:hypothetical protein [Altererythrobacter sp. CAU 1644]WFL75957.1 hypothetical protein P7228_08020 [Altererythrobacter sp. CAU 1644]